jgi:hypothetical protein
VDRGVVTRAALIVLAACACVKGSSKDDHAGPMAPSPSEAPAAMPQATAPGAVPERPSPAAAPAAARSSTALRIDGVASARAAIGKRVRLEGIGDNAKLGAVIVKGDLVVYCVDRKDGWDERNMPVVVEGILDYTNSARARTGGDGSITAGTGEPIFQMTCDLVR